VNSSSWLSIGFPILLAVVSMVVGGVVTIRYGMRKRLTYQRRSFGLVFGGVNKLPGMEIRYHGHGPSVENLTVSRIAIWNAGRGDVRKGDILGKENLRIVIDPKYVILASEVVQQKNAANCFEVRTTQEDQKTAKVHFDFVRSGEGVVVQVVHTGVGSKDLKVEGTLADVKILPSWLPKSIDEGASLNLTGVAIFLLILGALLGGLIVVLFLMGVKPAPEFLRLPWLARAAVMLVIVAILPIEIYLLDRLFGRPGGLEKFDENF
jgi:hypothetical protein